MKSPAQRRSSESIDDYLKAIYSLGGSDQRRVGSSELAAQRRPLIQYERGRGVRLSASGRKRALEIVRHHRLVETFLFEVLGYPLDELHDEAERLEHFISEKFEARVAAKLHNPTRDPHGHCIPALDGTMPPQHGIDCACGK